MIKTVWKINTTPPEEKVFGEHPTQKPVALLDRIIRSSTNKSDLILDPFCGSATTGVAALQSGRKFIGIDSEIEYLDKLAIPRIADFI